MADRIKKGNIHVAWKIQGTLLHYQINPCLPKPVNIYATTTTASRFAFQNHNRNTWSPSNTWNLHNVQAIQTGFTTSGSQSSRAQSSTKPTAHPRNTAPTRKEANMRNIQNPQEINQSAPVNYIKKVMRTSTRTYISCSNWTKHAKNSPWSTNSKISCLFRLSGEPYRAAIHNRWPSKERSVEVKRKYQTKAITHFSRTEGSPPSSGYSLLVGLRLQRVQNVSHTMTRAWTLAVLMLSQFSVIHDS